MTYEYPQIGATNPEETQPIPGMTYDFWAITSIAHTVQNVIEVDGQLRPVGVLTVRGQKLNYLDGVISPIGNATEFTSDDLFEALSEYPEFASGYNAFVEVCAETLELMEATAILRQMVAASFEDALRQIRKAYRRLDADAQADKARECIQNYPGVWTMVECLEYLGLIDPADLPLPPPTP